MATTTTHTTYGAEVSVAVKKRVASRHRKISGLVYPLTGSFKTVTGQPPALQNNTSEGGYFSKSSGLELIRNNLRQLILCEKGSRVMLPSYGMSLQKYLFEPLDETTFYLLKNEIVKTLNKYFSIANIISLSVYSPERDAQQHRIIISLTLQLLDESLELFDAEVTIA